jgi:diguanylate cyclase (GGDEF)-like protein
MAETRSLLELAERVAEEARFAFSATSVSLSQLEPEHGMVRALVNVGRLAPGEERFPVDERYEISAFPLLGLMVDEARPWRMAVDDPDGDPAERDLMLRLDVVSALAAPVLAEGRVWGELFATRAAGVPPFDDDDLAFAQAFAGMVSAGLAQVVHLATVERLAYHDPLTGLGNRRLVEERLEQALADRRGSGRPVTVVMADVNRLKQANDDHGHEAGDRALVAIAQALSLATGKVAGAVAGRIGGDEFCAVLPGHGIAVGETLASAFLRGTTEAPYGVSVACGVASTEGAEGEVTAARLFALADAAQYEAKRAGASHPVVSAGVTERERRERRGRTDEPGLLASALDVLAARRGQPVDERLVAVAVAVCAGCRGVGWVVSRLRAGAAVPVESATHREGVLVSSVPAPESSGWLRDARTHGIVVRADDEEVPLAAVRGCTREVVAAAGDWLVEVLIDEAVPPPDAPAVLKAALGVALNG